MQKTSHKNRPKEATNRRIVAINWPVSGRIDAFLVHAQGQDVKAGAPLKNKAEYLTQALDAGMQALGYKPTDKEVQND